MQITLHLQNLRFFGRHGIYEEEKQLGNQFELNISLSFPSEKEVVVQLEDSINYTAIYEIAKAEMQQPRELLETFLSQLAQKLKEHFPQISQLKMSIFKLQMPLVNFEGKIGVEIEKQY